MTTTVTTTVRPYDLIRRKRDGAKLGEDDIRSFIAGYMDGTGASDYQMSAFLMAAYFRGLDREETLALTRAYVESGQVLDLGGLEHTVDKHSTGGVGDKTTLVLGPMVAATGARLAKISGRGLGHTGGTVDKLESFPGFRSDLAPDEFLTQVRRVGLAVIGQTKDFVPADARIYALRDVTATVDSIPLIAASVMSKKLASGARSIVLDVKTGSGAFMRSQERAEELARAMVEIGRLAGRRTAALVTDMDQPLGRAVGNALEVREAIATLKGEGPEDLYQLCLALGGELLMLSGLAPNPEVAHMSLEAAVKSGRALETFRNFIAAQGGNAALVDTPRALPVAPLVQGVRAAGRGYVAAIDAEGVGRAAMVLGAGRARKGDPIDPAVGVEVLVKVGDQVGLQDDLAVVHARTPGAAADVNAALLSAFKLVPEKSPARPLVFARIA